MFGFQLYFCYEIQKILNSNNKKNFKKLQNNVLRVFKNFYKNNFKNQESNSHYYVIHVCTYSERTTSFLCSHYVMLKRRRSEFFVFYAFS